MRVSRNVGDSVCVVLMTMMMIDGDGGGGGGGDACRATRSSVIFVAIAFFTRRELREVRIYTHTYKEVVDECDEEGEQED